MQKDEEKKSSSFRDTTATSGTTPSEYTKQCVFCKNALSYKSEPYLLPCLHLSCKSCVPPAAGQCNQCSMSFEAGAPIPHIYLMDELSKSSEAEVPSLQASTGSTEAHTCTSCEENQPAAGFCKDCEDWLCETCMTAHQRVKVTKDHVIEKREQSSVSSHSLSHDSKHLYCKVHTKEKLQLYCETCDSLTCRDCQLLEHKDHHYQFLNEACQKLKLELNAILSRVKEKQEIILGAVKLLDKRQSDTSQLEQSCANDIKLFAVRFITEINRRGKFLLRELEQKCDARRAALRHQRDEYTAVAKRLTDSYRVAHDIVEGGSEVALVYSRKIVKNRLDAMLRERYEIPNPSHPFDVRFAYEPRILEQIQQIGNIVDFDTAPVDPQQQQQQRQHYPPGIFPQRYSHAAAAANTHAQQQYRNMSLQQQHAVATAHAMRAMHPSQRVSPAAGPPFYPAPARPPNADHLKHLLSPHLGVSTGPQPMVAVRGSPQQINGQHLNGTPPQRSSPLQHQQAAATAVAAPERGNSNAILKGMLDDTPHNVESAVRSTTDALVTKATTEADANKKDSNSRPIVIEEDESDGPRIIASMSLSTTEKKTDDPKQQVAPTTHKGDVGGAGEDTSDDWCSVCKDGGELLCCSECPRVYHLHCHVPNLINTPSEDWVCAMHTDKTPANGSSSSSGGSSATRGETTTGSSVSGKRKQPVGLAGRELHLCERLLLELFCHPDSQPFHTPISRAVPNYYKIIQRPMDLSTIKQKLSPNHFNHYDDVVKFVEDIKQVFINCHKFNPPEAELVDRAINMENAFDASFAKLLPDYMEQCGSKAKDLLAKMEGGASASASLGDGSSTASAGDAPRSKRQRPRDDATASSTPPATAKSVV